MEILYEGVRFSWDVNQSRCRKHSMCWIKKNGSNNPKREMLSTIWGGGNIIRKTSRNWDKEERVCVKNFHVMYCYTMEQIIWMSVDLNIPTNRCLIVWIEGWMKRWAGWRGGKGWIPLAYMHLAGQSPSHPQNPLHNIYETGLSNAWIRIILWMKPVEILLKM